jgi:hypothetical protein
MNALSFVTYFPSPVAAYVANHLKTNPIANISIDFPTILPDIFEN